MNNEEQAALHTVLRQGAHTHTQTEVVPDSKVISMTFSYSFMHENKYTARLCYTKSMYSKSQ